MSIPGVRGWLSIQLLMSAQVVISWTWSLLKSLSLSLSQASLGMLALSLNQNKYVTK